MAQKTAIRIICLFSIISISVFCDAGEFGVKEAGTGLGSTAYGWDAGSIFMNPASAGILRANCFTASYSKLAWGIGGASIERGLGSYLFRRRDLGGAGLSFTILNQDVSYYTRLGLTLAPEFYIFKKQFALGITGMWYQTGYRISEFQGHDIGLDPIFQNGQTKNAFGINAGIQGNIFENLWFGLTARDINEPNLAFQDTVGYGKRPLEIQAGLWYPVHRYFQPGFDLMWRNETINENRIMRARVGARCKLPKGFWLGAGYDGTGIDAGLTLHSTALFGGLDIDYAFVYPIEKDLASAGAMSHHFGLSIWGLEKKPIRVDLIAREIKPTTPLYPNVKTEIVGTIKNVGREASAGFSVSLAVRDESGNWSAIYPTKFLDGLHPDSGATLVWQWKPKDEGTYLLRMTVDDDGTNIPQINGIIAEKREDNNVAEFTARVGVSGNLDITFDTRKGFVSKLIYLVEERPLVPIIFFDIADTALDLEEIELLKIYSERMKGNPDARLVIEGFFDQSDGVACTSGAELALRRANAVKNQIMKTDPNLEKRIFIPNEINCAQPRTRIDPVKITNPAYLPLLAEENRRAELRIEFPNISPRFASYELKSGEIAPPEGIAFDDSAIAVVKRNDDAIIIISGGVFAGEDTILGLLRAGALRKAIETHDPKILPGKIRVAPGQDGGQVSANITGEGILWAPTLSNPSIIGYEGLNPEINNIRIKAEGFDKITIDSSRVTISATDGERVRLLHRGTGLPPAQIPWDWKDDGGHLILPETGVRVKAELFIGGKSLVFWSREGIEGRMKLVVKDIIRRIKRLLVVQFVFDETIPTSNYLESRLDGFAFDFISQAKGELSPSVIFAGHTDSIGTERRNQELSEKRASRELNILKQYMMFHLGLRNPSELIPWIQGRKVELGSIGYGAGKPYILQSVDPSGVPVMIGKNGTPRGRTINRRVTVEHGIDEKISQ